jgi:hypothetical protein
MLAFVLTAAWAQDDTTPPADTNAAPQQQPVPAYGQSGAPPLRENPPISGIDQPGLEPNGAPLSYLQPGATVSESADSNVASSLGGASVRSVSRAVGSLTLQRLWKNYDLALQYMGGAAYYDLNGLGWKMLQQMDLNQKITWKRGQLSLRDSFSYLPEGNFGQAYGSLGSEGIGGLGSTAFGNFWSGAALGTLGLVPRIQNVSLADLSENLTPKSAITVAGGYAFTHFYGTDPVTGVEFLSNSQASGQVGYNRSLSANTQIAAVYGYQAFDFSAIGTSFHSHIVQLLYGHKITGRLDFLIGAGPQITDIALACTSLDVLEGNPHCSEPSGNPIGTVPDRRIGVAGRMRLRYQFPKTSLNLTYERFETSGSGLFAGAETDVGQLRAERPLSRVWSSFADLGYTRNSRAQPSAEGVSANIYSLAFAGVGLHRAIGRNFHAFVSYQIDELWFDKSLCGTANSCNRISDRSIGTVGLDWTPRPIRID